MLKKQISNTKLTYRVTFTLNKEEAQGANSVKILGDFNNWNPAIGVPMQETDGIFEAVIELDAGRDYQFRYLTDKGLWINDSSADGYLDSPYDVKNSVISLPTEASTSSTKLAVNHIEVKEKSTAKVKAVQPAVAKSKAEKPAKEKATKVKAEKSAKEKVTKVKAEKPAKEKATKVKAEKPAKEKATKVKAVKPAKEKVVTKVKAEKSAKEKATKVKTTLPDDLKRIEGIGPKIAELLNKGGIHTFSDLAKTKLDKLKGILEAAGSRYKMHDPTTWPNQAHLAAKGAWDTLKQLQDELIGGKKA